MTNILQDKCRQGQWTHTWVFCVYISLGFVKNIYIPTWSQENCLWEKSKEFGKWKKIRIIVQKLGIANATIWQLWKRLETTGVLNHRQVGQGKQQQLITERLKELWSKTLKQLTPVIRRFLKTLQQAVEKVSQYSTGRRLQEHNYTDANLSSAAIRRPEYNLQGSTGMSQVFEQRDQSRPLPKWWKSPSGPMARACVAASGTGSSLLIIQLITTTQPEVYQNIFSA